MVEASCAECGFCEVRTVVQHGSYILMCGRCRTGPATSFIAIAPLLEGVYRASVVDEDWHELELVAQGGGTRFAAAISAAARTGKLVELKRVGP